uniref:Glucan endo-1,3-beta-glucosidase GVI n=1 Tax=Ananas comosus var. bracteatus TaxID=296719 RepID=A0A6V7NFG4_ANACO|nr:unnamed protein product [Ananas comosus var. bracteatus]
MLIPQSKAQRSSRRWSELWHAREQPPTPDKVVGLYASRGITKLRLFSPDAAALAALRGSGISVVLGTLNEDLQRLAADQTFAANWVQTNVAQPRRRSPHRQPLRPGHHRRVHRGAGHVVPAVAGRVLAVCVAGPHPHRGVPAGQGTPLLVNVYPYFAYAVAQRRPSRLRALHIAQRGGAGRLAGLHQPVRRHRGLGLRGTGEGGGPQVAVVVSETGWPSGGGGVGATVDNARLYNNNVVAHVESSAGTPRRPGKGIETYLFAMFNEDEKPAGTEQNFGLYRPDMSEVYHVNFAS